MQDLEKLELQFLNVFIYIL